MPSSIFVHTAHKCMDIVKSEARSSEENNILRDLLGCSYKCISVKKEPLITTCLVPFLPTQPMNVNAEPQHSTKKQPDPTNSTKCNASLHQPFRPVETKSDACIAEEQECCVPVQIVPQSEANQTNSESNTAQEPQCLGPFVKSSSNKCLKCSVVLTKYDQIFTHSCIIQDIYEESRKKKPECCFCDKKFTAVRSLTKHVKAHFQKKYVKCSICGKYLGNESSFKVHSLQHTNRWPYRCNVCDQGTATELQLEIHKAVHTEEKCYMCDVCGAMFSTQGRLNSHKTVHSEKKYECDTCFAKFKTLEKLKLHKKIHSDRQKYQCGDCSSAFSTVYQLKLHKEIKHEDNSGKESFLCTVCNKEFKHRSLFKVHMYKHKRENEDVMYTCDMCKRRFARKGSMARHIAEHNGKQFSCSECGMLFTQPSSVKRHMLKLHSSEG